MRFGPNKPLQQTGATVLVPRDIESLRAAPAAELWRSAVWRPYDDFLAHTGGSAQPLPHLPPPASPVTFVAERGRPLPALRITGLVPDHEHSPGDIRTRYGP